MKKIVLAIVVVVLIIIGVLALGDNDNSSNNNQTTSTGSAHNVGTRRSSQANTQAVATDKVSIRDMAFSPANITIKKGTSVTWTNNDAISHTVTENDGRNGPGAQPLAQDQTYSFAFKETGTFRYHCSIHPKMTGTVTVTD